MFMQVQLLLLVNAAVSQLTEQTDWQLFLL